MEGRRLDRLFHNLGGNDLDSAIDRSRIGRQLDGPVPFGPAAPIWEHGDPGDFYGGPTQCGAFRLSNGNTIICLRMTGYVFEVAMDGTLVWEYDHPSSVARAPKYWFIGGQWVGP